MTTTRRRDDWLVAQLPVGMVQDDFFRRFVSIFQDVATSFLEAADGLEHVADATVAPKPLLPWLGSWLGVQLIDPTLPEDLQRDVVRTAGQVLQWRGTKRGLTAWLEVLTGALAEVDDPGGVYREGEAPWRAPIVRVRVASTGWLNDEQFVRVVLEEVPAHVGLELFVGDRLLHPLPPPPEPEVEGPPAPEDAVPEDAVPEDAVPEDAVTQEVLTEDAATEEVEPEAAATDDATPAETATHELETDDGDERG